MDIVVPQDLDSFILDAEPAEPVTCADVEYDWLLDDDTLLRLMSIELPWVEPSEANDFEDEESHVSEDDSLIVSAVERERDDIVASLLELVEPPSRATSRSVYVPRHIAGTVELLKRVARGNVRPLDRLVLLEQMAGVMHSLGLSYGQQMLSGLVDEVSDVLTTVDRIEEQWGGDGSSGMDADKHSGIKLVLTTLIGRLKTKIGIMRQESSSGRWGAEVSSSVGLTGMVEDDRGLAERLMSVISSTERVEAVWQDGVGPVTEYLMDFAKTDVLPDKLTNVVEKMERKVEQQKVAKEIEYKQSDDYVAFMIREMDYSGSLNIEVGQHSFVYDRSERGTKGYREHKVRCRKSSRIGEYRDLEGIMGTVVITPKGRSSDTEVTDTALEVLNEYGLSTRLDEESWSKRKGVGIDEVNRRLRGFIE